MWFRVFLFLLLATPSWAGLPPTRILDEGTDKGIAFKFDCVGAGIVCSQSGVTGTLTVGTGAGGDSVSIDGVAVTDPNFNSTGDVDFVDTANVVTGTVVSVRPAAENSIEALLDLQDLQGAVTDGQVPNTITIDLATTATTANAGDSATAFFSAGSIESARGGTGTDSSGATGIARIDLGSWAAAELSGDVVTSGSNVATIADSVTVTGWVLGTSSATQITSPTVITDLLDASGAVDMDYGSADVTDHTFTTDGTGSGEIVLPAGSIDSTEILDGTILEIDLKAVDAAVDEECLTYESTTGDFEWQTCGGGGGGATSISLPIYSAKITGAFVVFTPPTADACTQGAQIDAGDGNWRLLFDATTDECATWQFVMPDNYSSTPLLDVMFSMSSGESNEVEFEAAVMCYTPTTDTADIGTASFSNVAVAVTTVSATAGEAYLATITLTDDSCAAGDIVFVVLSTDANDATNDDSTGDREVIGVNLRYTGS